MPNRLAVLLLAGALALPAAHAADLASARSLYLAGDLDGARAQLEELLAGDPTGDGRAAALELLGRVAVDREQWGAALAAWGELTDEHAGSPEADAVSAAIRPLRALAECGCSPAELVAAADSPGAGPPSPTAAPETPRDAPAAPDVDRPPAPGPPPSPPPAESSAAPAPDGALLIGGWGGEYDASQEVTARLTEFLAANGVPVRAGSTDVPAIRGEEVVLSHLIELARASGAAGVLFVTTRFDFREYVQVERYDVHGVRLWRERVVGGTALKERRDRGRPSWGLVERMQTKLSKKLGTPDLPTG